MVAQVPLRGQGQEEVKEAEESGEGSGAAASRPSLLLASFLAPFLGSPQSGQHDGIFSSTETENSLNVPCVLSNSRTTPRTTDAA